MVSTSVLKKITLYGALVTSGSVLLMSYYSQKQLQSSPLYTEALQLLHTNSTAVKLLGNPIRGGTVNYSDRNLCGHDGELGWVTIPVYGSKARGQLRYWVTRNQDIGNLVKAELSLDKIPGKKLVLKNNIVSNNIV